MRRTFLALAALTLLAALGAVPAAADPARANCGRPSTITFSLDDGAGFTRTINTLVTSDPSNC